MTTLSDLVAARRADVAADERRRRAATDEQTCAPNHKQTARRLAQEAIDAQHLTTRHFGRVARALADAGTLVERVEAAAAREEEQCLDAIGTAVAAAIGLPDDDCDTPAWAACYALACEIIERAEARATADRAEAARESADDVRDWEASR